MSSALHVELDNQLCFTIRNERTIDDHVLSQKGLFISKTFMQEYS